jgi:hypothetical protein
LSRQCLQLATCCRISASCSAHIATLGPFQSQTAMAVRPQCSPRLWTSHVPVTMIAYPYANEMVVSSGNERCSTTKGVNSGSCLNTIYLLGQIFKDRRYGFSKRY